MKRLVSTAAVLLLLAGTVIAQDRQAKADFAPAAGSHVTGFAQITQLPHGGSLLRIVVRGLTPGTAYSSFYYANPNCEDPADLLGNFSAMPNGTGEAHARIDENIDDVGSVSVRLGPGYGTLLACARMH
jgi:hypothetical protein